MNQSQNFSKRLTAQLRDPQSRFLIIVGSLVAICGFGYAVLSLKSNDVGQQASSVKGTPNVGFVPGGNVVSPFYERILQIDNLQRAQTALKTGGSNIPTLQGRINVSQDLTLPLPPTPAPRVAVSQTEIPAPKMQDYSRSVPVPKPPRLRVVAVDPPPPPPMLPQPFRFLRIQTDPAMQSAMQSQIQGILGNSGNVGGHSSMIFYMPKPQEKTAEPKETETKSEAKKKPALLVKTGDILYARLVNKAISTQPGPILGEIVTGKLRGNKLIGSFSRSREVLVLNFTQMIFPDGRKAPLNAVAIDPTDGTTGVATSVDRFFFERFVLKSASAFISSFAEAVAEPDNQTTISFITIGGQASQQQQDERSTEESLFAGVSAAADVVTDEIDNKSDEYDEPEVIVAQGTLFGLMFMDELREPISEDDADQDAKTQ